MDSALSFCVDRFPSEGARPYFDPGEAAGWYSAVCALLATAALVGIQLRIARADQHVDRPAILCLSATLIVAILGAFINAEVAGEVECNALAGRIAPAGGMIASAGILLLLSLGWILAEYGMPNQSLRLVHVAITTVVVLAIAYLTVSALWSEDVTVGNGPQLAGRFGFILIGPPAVMVNAAVASRIILRGKWRGITAEEAIDRRLVQWAVGSVMIVAISALVIADLVLVSVDVESARLRDLAPAWTDHVVLWSVAAVGSLAIFVFPWREAVAVARPAARDSRISGKQLDATEPTGSDAPEPWISITIHRRTRRGVRRR